MGRIPYFDFAAFIILTILLFSLFFRKMHRGRINTTFIALLLVLMISTVADALSTSELIHITDPALRNQYRMWISTVYFIFRILIGPVYIIFIGHLSGTWHKMMQRHPANLVALLLPYLICGGLLVYNLFSKAIFHYETDGTYVRGSLISIFYIIGIYYMLLSVFYLFIIRKYMDREKLITLFTILPLTGIAMIVQYLHPDILLEMFAYTIVTMLVNTIILRPEETFDPVTGAKSFRSFSDDIRKYFRSEVPVDLIFIRIKNSTALLAILGNEKHQLLQREIAEELRKSVPTKRNFFHDVYYLYNGLYAVLADGKTRGEFIEKESLRIYDFLKKPFHSSHLDLDLDASVCTLKCPDDIDNWEDLVSFAHSFHYNTPDDQVVVLSKIVPEKQFQMKNNINEIISQGIIHHSFVMYYQPIYSTREQRFTCAEALIRLFDEKNGMVSPGLFIPSAEKSGAIHTIGDFVVQDVCRFISDHNMKDLGLRYIEINLSAVQCMRNSIVTKVNSLLKDYHIPPAYVNFEITETASDFVHDTVKANVMAMHTYGLEFALDDYGTGYSNLQRMLDFPFKLIKLDKRFVDEWEDSTMRTVIRNTIHMLKDIGKEIVVEGVETEEEAKWFTEQNCDYIQGFYYAKPMPEKEFLEFLSKQK